MQDWIDRHAELAELARRQLFFVDGQPRSGTTWLQQMLDAHPEVSCKGEAQFRDHLAVPLDGAMRQRYQELHQRNADIFAHTGGYPLPLADDTQYILGTAMMLAFRQQAAGGDWRAIGEKTPGNIFFWPQMQSLFPQARLIAIARDPRDIITSAWHRFQDAPGADQVAKMAFVRRVLPLSAEWMRTMLAYRERYADSYRLVTYEALVREPTPVLAGLFRFLGVSDDATIVAGCLEETAFARQSGGRAAGVARNGAFHRIGVAGDWPSTLTPEMNRVILGALGWSFAEFGWA